MFLIGATMKCQKNRACIKQNPNSLPDSRKRCSGCDKIGKDKKSQSQQLKIHKSKWFIDIDNGYRLERYPIMIDSDLRINDVYKLICVALKTKEMDGCQ